MTPRYPLKPSDKDSLYWLLSMEYAGRVIRWATQAVVVTDNAGNKLVYAGGLALSFSEAFTPLSSELSIPQVALRELYLPDDMDLPDLVESGYPLALAPCELSLWVSGRTYEQRDVRFRGTARLADYGAQGEPISMTIRPYGVGTPTLYPPSEAVVTTTTWPSAADEYLDAPYPTVIGRPGFAQSTSTGINGGSPGLIVDTSSRYLLIAGHMVTESTVRVIDIEAKTEGNLAVTHRTDALGRTVATVTLPVAPSTPTYAAGAEYWVDWSYTGQDDGAMRNPFRTGVLEGAGDVIRWALAATGVEVDIGAWATAAPALNGYRIATYLDESDVNLWDWVQQHVLPLLPCSLIYGPDGVAPIVWRPWASTRDALATIDVGRDRLSRTGPVQYDDAQLCNELAIKFAPRSDGGDAYRRLVLTGRDIGGDQPGVATTATLRSSRAKYGDISGEPIDTAVVYDEATAWQVLQWQAAVRAAPWRSVSYDDPTGNYCWLRAGDCVLLTDDTLSFSSKVCFVQRVEWRDTVPSFTLLIVEDPARES